MGLWAGMFKNYCHVYNECPPICLIAKFHAKIGILRFGKKKCLIWVLWRAILKIYSLFYNQCPRNCFKTKFGAETKILQFRTKNAYLKSAPSNLPYSKLT